MALGDEGAFNEWLEREDPPYSLMRSIRAWIDRLDEAPWQAPSDEISEMTVRGEYQVRSAVVDGVEVIYKEEYSTRRVDLIHVGTRV